MAKARTYNLEQHTAIDLLESKPTDMNLGNATPEGLVDQLGLVKDVKKKIDAWEKFMVTAVKARMGDEESAQGDTYIAFKEHVITERISAPLAREVLDDETIESITDSSEYDKLTVKRK